MRLDWLSIKNMDDMLKWGECLSECERKLENFLRFCRKKNLKLKESKFTVLEEVEYTGAIVSADMVKREDVVNILPENGRIKVFKNLKKLSYKREIKTYCSMLASLAESEHPIIHSGKLVAPKAGLCGLQRWNYNHIS